MRKPKQLSDGYVFNEDGSPRVYASSLPKRSRPKSVPSTVVLVTDYGKVPTTAESKQRKRASFMAMLQRGHHRRKLKPPKWLEFQTASLWYDTYYKPDGTLREPADIEARQSSSPWGVAPSRFPGAGKRRRTRKGRTY